MDKVELLETVATTVAKNTGLNAYDIFYDLWDTLADVNTEKVPEGEAFTSALQQTAREWITARKATFRALPKPRQDKAVMRVIAGLTPDELDEFNKAFTDESHGAHTVARGLYAEAQRILGLDNG